MVASGDESDTGALSATRSSAPMDVNEDELAELAGARPKTSRVVRRLKAFRPAEATGKLLSDKASPATINEKEMAAIRKSGQATGAVRERYPRSEASVDATTELAAPSSAPERVRKPTTTGRSKRAK